MKKALAILLCGLLILGILAGCNKGGTTTTTKKDEPSKGQLSDRTDLNVNAGTQINSVDPMNSQLSGESFLRVQVYEAMIDFYDGEFHPCLAEKWELNEDNTEITFTLKKGVKFHNGEELKADDVVYSVERAMQNATMSSATAGIDHAEAVSDYVVKIVYANPSGVMINNATKIWIMNRKFSEANDMATKTCGTGPYYVDNHVELQYIDLKAFPDYHGGEAYIKTVHLTEVYDNETILSSFIAGELDYSPISTANVNYVKEMDKWDMYEAPSNGINFFIFNCEKEPINNKLVRQACAYATDKQGFIDMCSEGFGTVADVFCQPGIVFGATTEGCTIYDYNLDKAAAKLKEAGYENGINIGTITTTGSTRSAAIQAQWKLANIECDCEIGDASQIINLCASGATDMSMMGDSGYHDFCDCSYLFTSDNLGSLLLSRFVNSEVDRLFAAGAGTADTNERLAIFKELNALLQDEQPYIPLYYGVNNTAYDRTLNFSRRDGADNVYFYDLSWK